MTEIYNKTKYVQKTVATLLRPNIDKRVKRSRKTVIKRFLAKIFSNKFFTIPVIGVSIKFDDQKRINKNFSTIAKMLSYDKFNKKHWIIESDNYNEYIKNLKENIKEEGMENYIRISPPHNKMDAVQGIKYRYLTKHTIIVENLNIVTDNESKLHLDELVGDGFVPKDFTSEDFYSKNSLLCHNIYDGAIRIEFRNNKFIAKNKEITCYAELFLGDKSHVTFTQNKFENVGLYLNLKKNPSSFVNLENNTFEVVSFEGGGDEKTNSLYKILKADIADKIFAVEDANKEILSLNDSYDCKFMDKIDKNSYSSEKNILKDILKMLFYINKKINILPEHVATQSNLNTVRIANNEFSQLRLSGAIDFFFHKKNIIDEVFVLSLPSNIHWNRHQVLDEHKSHAYSHKRLFIELKIKAIERRDKFQELLFSREIEICEKKILSKEKPFWNFFQDRVVLLIAQIFSDHGISWFRPLAWLLGVNLVITFWVGCLISTQSNFLYILSEMFNPISNLVEVSGHADTDAYKKDGKYKVIFSVLNNFQKLFYAGMAYETIKVFRRFIAK